MTSFAIDQLSWPEIGRRVARDPRLIRAVDEMEQHGPHLPYGSQHAHRGSRRPRRFTTTRHSTRSDLLLPDLDRRGPFAGAAGLRRKTLHRAINELPAQWEDDGVSEFIIIITAHRYEPHWEALLMALTAESTNSVCDLYQIDVRDIVQSDPESEHGGELETSLLLHLAPNLVRMDQAEDFVPDATTLRKYTRGRVPAPPPESRGVVGRPTRATEAKGAALFERYVREISPALGAEPACDANAAAPEV